MDPQHMVNGQCACALLVPKDRVDMVSMPLVCQRLESGLGES